MKYCINMMSRADSVQCQGVASAYKEQVALVENGLSDRFCVTYNSKKPGNINHYHTVNFPFYLSISRAKRKGSTVGYVHFLPETLEQSLKLPKLFKKVFYKYLLSFYGRMDYLVTVNPYFIDRLAAYGIDRSKVTYIPNFVNEKDFFPFSKSEIYPGDTPASAANLYFVKPRSSRNFLMRIPISFRSIAFLLIKL